MYIWYFVTAFPTLFLLSWQICSFSWTKHLLYHAELPKKKNEWIGQWCYFENWFFYHYFCTRVNFQLCLIPQALSKPTLTKLMRIKRVIWYFFFFGTYYCSSTVNIFTDFYRRDIHRDTDESFYSTPYNYLFMCLFVIWIEAIEEFGFVR